MFNFDFKFLVWPATKIVLAIVPHSHRCMKCPWNDNEISVAQRCIVLPNLKALNSCSIRPSPFQSPGLKTKGHKDRMKFFFDTVTIIHLQRNFNIIFLEDQYFISFVSFFSVLNNASFSRKKNSQYILQMNQILI